MAAKVEDDFGRPADDGCGRLIWCEACKIQQPLPKPFNLQNWRVHVTTEKHKSAAQARRCFVSAAPEEKDSRS